jgi:hypothetical protein
MKIVNLFSFFMISFALQANAAEFTWFGNIENRQGWIESVGTGGGYQSRIHVFPELIGPKFGTKANVERTKNGALITFIISSSLPTDTGSFIKSVIRNISGALVPGSELGKYQLDLVTVKDLTVKLKYNGGELGSTTFKGKLPVETVGQIATSADKDVLDDILNGKFILEATFTIAQGTYSAIMINVKNEVLTKYRYQALKEVTTQREKSGGSFLFFNWSSTTVRKIITEKINEHFEMKSEATTSVMSVDPTPDMRRRIDERIGFYEVAMNDLIQKHLDTANKMKTLGEQDIAKIFEDYANAVKDGGSGLPVKQLEKALIALEKDPANMAVFMANGIAFDFDSYSSYGKYQCIAAKNLRINTENSYTEIEITTQYVDYTVTSGPFPFARQHADEVNKELIRSWFGTVRPGVQEATSGLYTAVTRQNVAMARMALDFKAQFNAEFGFDGARPLIMAAKSGNAELVDLLLLKGANPYLTDRSHRDANYYAATNGYSPITNSLGAFKAIHPRRNLTIIVPDEGNMKIQEIIISDDGAFTVVKNNRVSFVSQGNVSKEIVLIITAIVAVSPNDFQRYQQYYPHFEYLGALKNAPGYVFKIKDTVRCMIDVGQCNEDYTIPIGFDPSDPGITPRDGNGEFIVYDKLRKMEDISMFVPEMATAGAQGFSF